jgi:bilirubin oxidase
MGRASSSYLVAACLILLVDMEHPRAAGAIPFTAASATEASLAFEPPTFRNLSREPRVVEVSLVAAPTRLTLIAGKATPVFAYNGHVPGPTLDVYEGDSVIIHFENRLPEPTTVHWHGLHIPASEDGSPFQPVMPGERHDFAFRIAPGTAGTYWYHPHPDRRAGYQVAMGLYGAIIVRSRHDPIPSAVHERLLVLSDNRLHPDGSVAFADSGSQAAIVDAENGREGNVLMVNGHVMPSISIRSGEVQRWRIINASAARIYRLSLEGATILHVADDGGLFERPERVRDVVLANSDRVEILVRGDAAPGTRTVLRTLSYDRYDPHTRPEDWEQEHDLLSLRYSDAPPVAPVHIPSSLRVVAWLDTAQVAERRTLVLTQGMINGKTMDMNRVDFTGRVGTTEIWEIENLVSMHHPFHLHGFRFQVLDRNGVPELVPRWEDTIDVPGHESARIVVRFDDFPGKWMFHCHIMDHEDMGMMGVLLLE